MAETAVATSPTTTTSTTTSTITSKVEYIDKLWMHLKRRITTVTSDDVSFETMTKFMSDASNIRLTRSLYGMLSSFCLKQPVPRRHGSDDSAAAAAEDVKLARLILSSLMIFKFPTDVLDAADVTDLEPMSEACYTSAQQLVECILQYDSSMPKLQCDELFQRIHRFIDSFNVWKSNDAQKVLQSLRGYYGEWMRSYQVLRQSAMNEAQKKSILNVLVDNLNKTQNKMAKLCGMERAKTICQEVKEAVENSANAAAAAEAAAKPQAEEEEAEEKEEKTEKHEVESLRQRLANQGVPMHMQSGNARSSRQQKQPQQDENEDAEEEEEKEESSKYMEMVNGQQVLNLDAIVMEEASKKYWSDFEQQILVKNYSRLFQILSELLQRLKVLSVEKQHPHLDDLLDVRFLSQTIENGNIDAQAFYGIYLGIWSQIKSLHAPQEDAEWQKWHDHVMQQFGSENATWATLLSEVFNVFLRKMDRIEDQIKVIEHVREEKKK